MHVIARFYAYYEEVQLNIDKEPGTVFNYFEDFNNGLKVIAEIMARLRRSGFATMFIPTGSAGIVTIMPTAKCRLSFQIGSKLDKLYRNGGFLLCLQKEVDLLTGNFIVMGIDEEGISAKIYTVNHRRSEAVKLTEVSFDYAAGMTDEFAMLNRLCLAELDMMVHRKPTGNTDFGVLN